MESLALAISQLRLGGSQADIKQVSNEAPLPPMLPHATINSDEMLEAQKELRQSHGHAMNFGRPGMKRDIRDNDRRLPQRPISQHRRAPSQEAINQFRVSKMTTAPYVAGLRERSSGNEKGDPTVFLDSGCLSSDRCGRKIVDLDPEWDVVKEDEAEWDEADWDVEEAKGDFVVLIHPRQRAQVEVAKHVFRCFAETRSSRHEVKQRGFDARDVEAERGLGVRQNRNKCKARVSQLHQFG